MAPVVDQICNIHKLVLGHVAAQHRHYFCGRHAVSSTAWRRIVKKAFSLMPPAENVSVKSKTKLSCLLVRTSTSSTTFAWHRSRSVSLIPDTNNGSSYLCFVRLFYPTESTSAEGQWRDRISMFNPIPMDMIYFSPWSEKFQR